MTSVAEEKAQLRNELKAARAARVTSADESTRLSQQLGQYCIDNKVKTAAAYFPIDGEPDVREFLDWAISQELRLLLPVVAGNDLNWVEYDGSTRVGQLGFEEGTGKKASLADAQVVFTPALAVDLRGNRLGKGKGYYDRTLESQRLKKVAVVFDEEILLSIPVEAHDHRVDAAISASKLVWFNR